MKLLQCLNLKFSIPNRPIFPAQLSDVEKCVLEFLGAARGADLIRGLGFERERFDPGHPMWRREEEEEE